MDSIESAVTQRPGVSVIIPVLHDSDALRKVVSDLKEQTTRPKSIIIVSGSHDAEIAQFSKEEELVHLETIAARGLQLDSGARTADAHILWFVHADARLPTNACEAVVTAIRHGAVGGCLRFTFQGNRSLRKRIIEQLVRLRVFFGGMAYGDQALFMISSAYADCDGFPHLPLFEEVPVVRYLRRTGRFAALSVPVFVSPRRWERDGWLRRSLHNRWLALRHFCGANAADLAAVYRHRATDNKVSESTGKARELH